LTVGVLFDDPQQLAQMMGVAQGVGRGRVGTVLRPAVVDGDPLEVRHHAGVVDALGAAPVVQGVQRQRLGAGAVKPPQPAAGASAGLVEVHDRRVDDLLVHPVEELAEAPAPSLTNPTSVAGDSGAPSQSARSIAARW
jgi:hypothetical protein